MRHFLAGLIMLGLASNATAAACKVDAYFVDQDPTTNISCSTVSPGEGHRKDRPGERRRYRP